ncbi:hydroxymethylglutaryl-CoA lyase [Fusibacter paucivorans]|uniref:Hydroxymethylglutaryl-CoA lyase n=1 Tax=Fusibacter paucivorans TaxID=76009 RepID=A0ABS5PUB5_9FIRM|nr:hydroxymethylglutaryl-CoA lyase [Fusibacter paucivorans]MBS7528686.1 hydroxymethylglutaryl-CoA lyase [Fusibacter paucivorans]
MNYPNRINICEVGPRDGLQNEKKILTTDEKVELIDMAIDAGYKVIEVGSLVHPKAIPALADTEEVFKRIQKPDDVELRVLITNLRGVERAINAGIKKVKLTVSASESHNMSNFNRKTEETVEQFAACIELARANNIEVSAAISTSFGCPFEGYISMAKIEPIIKRFIEMGLTEISLSDTTGMAYPKDVREKCKYVMEKYPEIKWNLHFHNTRDLGFVNVMAAMEAGIVNFDASFSGVGGCPYAPGASGNICSEDLLHLCQYEGIETGVDLDKAIALAKRAADFLGHKTDSYMLRAGKISDLTKEKPTEQKN